MDYNEYMKDMSKYIEKHFKEHSILLDEMMKKGMPKISYEDNPKFVCLHCGEKSTEIVCYDCKEVE